MGGHFYTAAYTRELVHDDKDPVGLEEHEFTLEQIDAPKAVFHMPDEGELGGAAPRIWPIFLGENAPHNILIDIDAKGPGNLLRDLGTAEPGVAVFYIQNELNKLWRRPLGSGFSLSL